MKNLKFFALASLLITGINANQNNRLITTQPKPPTVKEVAYELVKNTVPSAAIILPVAVGVGVCAAACFTPEDKSQGPICAAVTSAVIAVGTPAGAALLTTRKFVLDYMRAQEAARKSHQD